MPLNDHPPVPPPSRRPKLALAAVLVALAAAAAWCTAASRPARGAAARPTVLVTTLAGPITPVAADHLVDALREAAREGHEAYVVRLDTPGGLDASMREIVQAFLDADAPVVVWVAPEGARAASAGAFITWAAHVAAMAPATSIGAATPVDLGSGEAVGEKIVNDAASYAAAIAEARGRPVDFAVAAVREGRSVRASEALELGVVDLEARSLGALLEGLDGRRVTMPGAVVTLRTAGAAVVEHDPGAFRQVMQWLAHPNVAFLLLSLGTLALIVEVASPGIGVGGVVGAILLLLGLFALAVLPVNVVGLLLLALAAALLVAELFAPGIGVLALAGAVALVLSGLFLFRDVDGLEVSLAVLLPVAVVVAAAVTLAGRLVVRARRRPATETGVGALVGQVATVARAHGSEGQAHVVDGWWTVRTADGSPLQGGERVRVVEVDGLDLIVERAVADEPPSEARRTSP